MRGRIHNFSISFELTKGPKKARVLHYIRLESLLRDKIQIIGPIGKL